MEVTTNPRSTGILANWKAQSAVLHGLILRNFQSRFGRNNIGFFWVVLEPLILASVITGLHVARGNDFFAGGMSPYTFTVVGYCLIVVFRNNFGRAAGSLKSAQIMFHSQITPFDMLFTRFVVETFGVFVAFAILMVGGILTGYAQPPARFEYFILGILELTAFSFGAALIAAVYSLKSEVIERLIQPVAYFMFPLSGAFFTMSALPPYLRVYFGWNPMMTMFETVRYGAFETASGTYIYTPYALICIAISLFWGMLALRLVRPYITA